MNTPSELFGVVGRGGCDGLNNLIFCDRSQRSTFGISEGKRRGVHPHLSPRQRASSSAAVDPLNSTLILVQQVASAHLMLDMSLTIVLSPFQP
jgi:hypothetical protein